MDVAIQHAQHGHLLTAMMCGVRHPPHHDPGAAARRIEELHFLFPEGVVLGAQGIQPFVRVLPILPDKTRAGFGPGQGRRAYVDAEKLLKPVVFADAFIGLRPDNSSNFSVRSGSGRLSAAASSSSASTMPSVNLSKREPP